MRCEHYWRDGILLVERGQADPHRDSCLDCRREHESRGALVRALQLVGADGGDPQWQARVWRRIEAARAAAAPPRYFPAWVGAAAVACALLLFVSVTGAVHREGADDATPDQALVDIRPAAGARAYRGELPSNGPAAAAAQPLNAYVGDDARIWTTPDQEVRLYRGATLIARCVPGEPAPPRCLASALGVVLVYPLDVLGRYSVLTALAGVLGPADPATSIDRDLSTLWSSSVSFQRWAITVR